MTPDNVNVDVQQGLLSLEDVLCITMNPVALDEIQDVALLNILQQTAGAPRDVAVTTPDDNISEKASVLAKEEITEVHTDAKEENTSPVAFSSQSRQETHETASIMKDGPRSCTAVESSLATASQQRIAASVAQQQLRTIIEKPTRDSFGTSKKAKHICSECGKEFKRAHNLKIHGRLHTGDKPFVCPFDSCNKNFRWKSSIVSHINWHRTKRGDVLPGEPGDTFAFRDEQNCGANQSSGLPISRALHGSEIDAIQRKHRESLAAKGASQENEMNIRSMDSRNQDDSITVLMGGLDPNRRATPVGNQCTMLSNSFGGIDEGITVITPSTTSGSRHESPPLLDVGDLDTLMPQFSMSPIVTGENGIGFSLGKAEASQGHARGTCIPGFSTQKGDAHAEVHISGDPFPFLDESPV